jgi:hypothetical protein
MKKPRGQPPRGAVYSLLIAGAIQRHEKCSDWAALRQAAQLAATKEDPAENVLARLQYELKRSKCKTLAGVARRCRLRVTRKVTREADLAGTIRNRVEFSLSPRD